MKQRSIHGGKEAIPKNYNLDIGDLLLVLFVGLKLTGHIDWSWWWVLSPIWIMVILALFAADKINKEGG